VKIKTLEKIEGKNVFVGIIKGENEGIVTVCVKGKDTRISFEMIKKAALEFEG
jgi:ribosome maturation factor RimP